MTKRNQKDTLAKLMATENITVVHKKIPTAYFDVKNRILACPIFKEDISDELYDLFMGHEVGHALNTPYEGLHSALELNRTLKGYLNVVEDVRIEKAIKNKFQGLRKSFFTAYNELMEMDFFQLKKRNLAELSLIDKINLQTKVGSRLGLKFNTVEQGFLDMAEACKTWEDVVECATAIYEYSKENETRTEDDEMLVPQMFDVGDDEENEEGDESEEFESSNEDYEDEYGDSEEDEEEDSLPEIGDNVDQGDSEEDEVDEETETEEEADNQVKSTGGKEGGKDQGFHDDEDGARESITEHFAHNNEEQFLSDENIIMSSINLKDTFKNNDMKDVVIPFKTVISDWKKYITDNDSYYSEERRFKEYSRGCFAAKRLEQKNKKIVAHMAKEFEMKQTAKVSKKAFTGKTGKLDMNRLAKYQIVDDIFKRAIYLPEGQNHGLNVLVDWSGSICDEVTDLLEQSMILAEFCRKTNIPYRVYLFSDAYYTGREKEDDYGYRDNGGKLIEILSNEMNNRQHKEMMTYLGCMYANYFSQKIGWRNYQKSIAKYNEFFGEFEALSDDGRYWDVETNFRPQNYRLGGTPLDQTLVALRKLLPEFNAKYNVEKSILTVITDGFSHSADFLQITGDERRDIAEQEKTIGEDSWRCRKGRDLIDPYLNKVFTLNKPESGYGYRSSFETTQNLLHWISETCDVVITGYFVLGRKADLYNIMPFVKGENFYDYDSAWREIRKEGKVFKCHGYNKLFITHANNMQTDGSDELGEEYVDAKKVRVMAAFKRNQKSKTTSRFLTNEFIKEIA
jgi:hypothetical protein